MSGFCSSLEGLFGSYETPSYLLKFAPMELHPLLKREHKAHFPVQRFSQEPEHYNARSAHMKDIRQTTQSLQSVRAEVARLQSPKAQEQNKKANSAA